MSRTRSSTKEPGSTDWVKRNVLIASILGSGIVFLDQTIVNVALPAIRSSLNGSLAEQQWVVEAYLLTLASLLLLGGSLGDVLGRRRVFQAGLLGFGVCSLVCAAAPSSEVLILARGVQGVAGALLVPSSLALILDTFGEGERAAAIGTWTAWTGVATVIGPLGGGLLVQAASWRWIFLINPIPVAITVMLLRRLPPDRRAPGHVDWIGGLLCVFGLGGTVFGLIEHSLYGWGDPRVFVPLIAGLILLVAFLAWERRTPEPMMPLQLFAVRNFAVGNVTTLAMYGGLAVATFFLVLFLQQVAGYTPLEAGLALLPITLVIFALSRRAGALADRIGPRVFMSVGPAVAGVGLLVLSRITAHPDYVTAILPGVLVFALGLAATVAPLTATVLGSVEPGHSGLASGANNAVARIAGLVAIAAVGAVVSTTFAARLDHNVAHEPLTRQARTALSTARTRPLVTSTPGLPHEALVDASVHAFRIGVTIAGLLVILGGVISVVGIENPRRQGSLAAPWQTHS
ncbi:MAG TPA: DHA2 family efflux MFS transporter permease subunit [Solirubrobacteraceae bacterium]|nr:DHA2 family efflux MFS transporter permease subunit [Solirubrobacteraceae bacterium]